jgi:hypothetical protein
MEPLHPPVGSFEFAAKEEKYHSTGIPLYGTVSEMPCWMKTDSEIRSQSNGTPMKRLTLP